MKPYRSMLFVPGHKSSWAEKAVATHADAIILDLEDSVPPQDKEVARSQVRESITRLHEAGSRADIWVRPNSADSGLQGLDFEAVTMPGLAGYFLPKVKDAREVIGIDAVVSHLEQREALPAGSVELIISYETAYSMAHCEEIAGAAPRIASLLGATGPSADVGRELGFEFTLEGLETLYLRSRIVLAARSKNLHHPVGGVWQDIADLDGCRRFAEDQRGLGYRGLVCIHPSHVAIANEVFTPPAAVVDRYRRMVDAYYKAEAEGHAAVVFEGQMIDLAHARTAQGVLDLADAIGSAS
jgi:citrate lyase subunit beta/citryl-CoA lyase